MAPQILSLQYPFSLSQALIHTFFHTFFHALSKGLGPSRSTNILPHRAPVEANLLTTYWKWSFDLQMPTTQLNSSIFRLNYFN